MAAAALIDGDGQIIGDEVNFDAECKVLDAAEKRAKCATLEAFGRALHGAQDFYAHSNWADEANPDRPMGDDNPPGLNLPAPSPVLDLRSDIPPVVPPGLATGCFVLRDEVPGVGECEGRVTHAALNKDNGLVDPATGRNHRSDDVTRHGGGQFREGRRGGCHGNPSAMAGLPIGVVRPGTGRKAAALMTCSLTHDDPVNDCRGPGWVRVLARDRDRIVVVCRWCSCWCMSCGGAGPLADLAGRFVVVAIRHSGARSTRKLPHQPP